jgi:hypothetical protein
MDKRQRLAPAMKLVVKLCAVYLCFGHDLLLSLASDVN